MTPEQAIVLITGIQAAGKSVDEIMNRAWSEARV